MLKILVRTNLLLSFDTSGIALKTKKLRGAHRQTDYPLPSNGKVNTQTRKQQGGLISLNN
jgi:hypothetical protein